jgi:hypothetical protein
MKNFYFFALLSHYMLTTAAAGYTGEASLGLYTVFSPDINENAMRFSGHYMVSRFWSLGLTAEAGFGDPKDSLESPMLQELDRQYSVDPDNKSSCHLSSMQGYEYRGISANFGAHPIYQAPAFRIYAGLGNNQYNGYRIGCFGVGSRDNPQDRLGYESEYNFSTPVSYAGLSYTANAMGVNWNTFAVFQKAMTTKVTGTTDENWLNTSNVDDIAVADRLKVGFGLSYVMDDKKTKVISERGISDKSEQASEERMTKKNTAFRK